MPEMNRKNILIRIILFGICCLLLTGGLTLILKPKRVDPPYDNTRKERGFYAEERDSLDYIFVGSSQLFSTVMPEVLLEEQGIRSYVFAGNEQPFSISYYYIMEALKYQKPKAIVLEATFCNWEEAPRESVIRINFDDMRWGKAKILGIMNHVKPKEWEYYFFELSKYHSRWDSLTAQDFKFRDAYIGKNPTGGWSYYGKSTEPEKQYGTEIALEILSCEETRPLSAEAMNWLWRISQLCEREQVPLILIKTPNGGKIVSPAAEGEEALKYTDGMAYYNELAKVAAKWDIPFLNMNLVMPGTNHNDEENARKATSYIGHWLKESEIGW